jgi:2-oxoglutarate ferredoxin oxidoreductase subunit alpha
MTETPIVIMLGQRPGPSTGLPTYSAQGDLRFALHAGQGEFPRVVIAPGDTEECFYETMRAFNWAEKYQLPVILLTDKYLVESERSVEPFDQGRVRIKRGDLITEKYENSEEYKRLKFTETGVSPRIVPSTKNAVARVTGDEHNEYGFTSEDPQITENMNEKRMRKLSFLARELEDRNVETTKFYGSDRAAATIISWGSTKGPIMEAMRFLDRESIEMNYLQIIYLMPFPTSRVQRALNHAKKTIVVENNMTSQLSGLIQEHTLRDVNHKILKYDGRPFNAAILANRIKEAL